MQTLRRQARAPEDHLLLVWDDGALAGYGYATRFLPPRRAPPHVAPAGWYLMGVRVLARRRRQGIAAALTAARMAWLRGRADAVWYFTGDDNDASIALHAPHGFQPTGRPFWFPGVLEPEAQMTLYRAQLYPPEFGACLPDGRVLTGGPT